MTSSIEGVEPPAAGETVNPVNWTGRDIAIGLGVLLCFRCLSLVSREVLETLPTWLLVGASAILPQAFLVAYPFVIARRRGSAGAFRWPRMDAIVLEFALAIPVVVGIVAALIATALILSRFSPHTTLTPEAIRRAAEAPSLPFMILFVVAATVVAPLCEEVFFRGFLQSALRMRLPVVVAALAQSAIFAAAHTFGVVHGVAVFILGLILTAVCEWRKSLLAPMFVHAGNNLVASLGFLALVYINAHGPVLGIQGHDHPQGCQVDAVIAQSGAGEAGIAVGDIVTELNGEPVTGFQSLRSRLFVHQAGETVTVEILRNGESREFKVVLQKRPTVQ